MVTLVKKVSGLSFPCGLLTGFLVGFGLLLYKTSDPSWNVLLPQSEQHLRMAPKAADSVWDEWERTWEPPGDDEDWGKLNCTVPPMRNADDYYNYILNRTLPCQRMVMVGGQLKTHPPYLVGEKWVCMDSKSKVVPGRCVALSFGIERDFSFDDDLDKRFNCKVHAFDPTINTPTHRRSPNIMFYDVGISDADHLDVKVKMARYSTILQKLKLEETTIDYLKIDVEGYEKQFFSDVLQNTPNLLKKVKQIGMEVHTAKDQNSMRERLWMYFGFLRCYGFKVMFSEINPVKPLRFPLLDHERSCCYEVVWGRDKQW